MEFPWLPTPRPCPPWLHGRYPLPSYYEDSDPDRPVRHQPWFPASRHLDFPTFRLQPSTVLVQTRSTPSTLAALFCSGFAFHSKARQNRRPNRVHLAPNRGSLLRTVRSLPVASHPGVSPRRSYFRLLVLQCRPGQGLPPCYPSALSGARARASAPAALRVARKARGKLRSLRRDAEDGDQGRSRSLSQSQTRHEAFYGCGQDLRPRPLVPGGDGPRLAQNAGRATDVHGSRGRPQMAPPFVGRPGAIAHRVKLPPRFARRVNVLHRDAHQTGNWQKGGWHSSGYWTW